MKALINRLRLRARFGPTVKIRSDSYISKDVQIGDHTYIGRRCDISGAIIGRYVSIGNNVSIGLGEHPVEFVSTSHHFHEDRNKSLLLRSEIGHDVWIGADAIIRRGVKIGTGAIIGANSFVNRDVPEYAIVAGSPAKLIRYRFDETTREILLHSKWWESDPAKARRHVHDLQHLIDSKAVDSAEPAVSSVQQ